MLNGKNIIITGANRGIGKAIAIACMMNHANIFACMRNCNFTIMDELNSVAREYGSKVTFVEMDLADETSIKKAASEILNTKEVVHGLVKYTHLT